MPVEALRQVAEWPATTVAVGVVSADAEIGAVGPRHLPLAWASVTKLLTALAVLVGVEEGTVELDGAAGPPGSTLRHLLAHASGLPPDQGPPLAPPGRSRSYSNAGFEEAAALLERSAAMPFGDYLRAAVIEPLCLEGELSGSPAWGYEGPLDDLLRLGSELLAPTLVAPETLAEATTVQFPGLDGVLPGFGRMEPNDWGLGFELRDAKAPHWTGARNSPLTFGHFGRSGSFLWIDPDAGLACGGLCDLDFGAWSRESWPRLADAVLGEAESK